MKYLSELYGRIGQMLREHGDGPVSMDIRGHEITPDVYCCRDSYKGDSMFSYLIGPRGMYDPIPVDKAPHHEP